MLAVRNAEAVPPLVDLGERDHGVVRQSEAGRERSAHLAHRPCAGRARRRQSGQERLFQTRLRRTGPRTEPVDLCGKHRRIARVEYVKCGLERDVVSVVRGHFRGGARAADGAEQGSMEYNATLGLVEPDPIGQRGRDQAGREALFEWEPGGQICRQRQRGENLHNPDRRSGHTPTVVIEPAR